MDNSCRSLDGTKVSKELIDAFEHAQSQETAGSCKSLPKLTAALRTFNFLTDHSRNSCKPRPGSCKAEDDDVDA